MSKLYASAVIAVAVAEIGYHEKASNSQLDNKTADSGSGNYTKYARDFDTKWPNWYNGKKNGFAWCDMFVDWCFLMAFGYEAALRLLCQPERSAGAGCTYSLAYYKQKGRFYTGNPKPGDQIFFGTSISNSNHTGLVEKVDSSKVYTIEGNTSDQVARRTYSLSASNILGYGRPDYDAEIGASTGGSTASATPTAPAPAATPAASSSPVTEKMATGKAQRFDGSIAGTYKVTASSGLHIRNGSNLQKPEKSTSLAVLPYGTNVQNYGYFNVESDGKWLYIQVVYNGVKYTGFSHSDYLSKQ